MNSFSTVYNHYGEVSLSFLARSSTDFPLTAKSAEAQAALQSAHNELQLLRKEHEEYKQRAAGILQVRPSQLHTHTHFSM